MMNNDFPTTEDDLSALLVEPILPSQDVDLNSSLEEELECDVFELDMLFDLIWDTHGNEMRRAGLSEESIFYYHHQRMRKVGRSMRTIKRSILPMQLLLLVISTKKKLWLTILLAITRMAPTVLSL